MDDQQAAVGKPLEIHVVNKVEEVEKTPSSDDDDDDGKNPQHIQRHQIKGIFTFDLESKMESISTTREDFTAPEKLKERTRGIRSELLEKQMARIRREQMMAGMNPPTPESVYRTTTQDDFCAQGSVPHAAETTTLDAPYNRKNEAITFWSENRQRVSSNSSFKKSSGFSTPITQRLDEVDD